MFSENTASKISDFIALLFSDNRQQATNTMHMDTEDLSREAYTGIIIEAEKLTHDEKNRQQENKSMKGFKITTLDNQEIKFEFYIDTAPVTSKAFIDILPFTRTFHHARVSGQEIWIDNVPKLDIIQENASVFTKPGEAVFGPTKPIRTKTANCFGIYYGDGKGLDACNIFARVIESDKQKLIDLGTNIWKNGTQELTISVIEINK